VIILVLVSKNKGGGGGNSGNRGGRGPSLLDILVLSSLGSGGRGGFGGGSSGGGFGGVIWWWIWRRRLLWRWLEWRLVTDSVSITKKSCSFEITLCITCENTSFHLYTGKFLLLSTSRVPFL
jgi:hypothetical protein